MTLSQSALLDLTDVLRTADGGQVMRSHALGNVASPRRCGGDRSHRR
jgi:hypothetical protein